MGWGHCWWACAAFVAAALVATLWRAKPAESGDGRRSPDSSAARVMAGASAAVHTGCRWMPFDGPPRSQQPRPRPRRPGRLRLAQPFGGEVRAREDAAVRTEEQKQLACLDLRDHIVALYADEYVEQQGLEMSRNERDAFRERVGRGAGEEGHVRALRAVVLLQPDAAQVPVRHGLADDRRSRRVHEAQLSLSASGRSHVTVAGDLPDDAQPSAPLCFGAMAAPAVQLSAEPSSRRRLRPLRRVAEALRLPVRRLRRVSSPRRRHRRQDHPHAPRAHLGRDHPVPGDVPAHRRRQRLLRQAGRALPHVARLLHGAARVGRSSR